MIKFTPSNWKTYLRKMLKRLTLTFSYDFYVRCLWHIKVETNRTGGGMRPQWRFLLPFLSCTFLSPFIWHFHTLHWSPLHFLISSHQVREAVSSAHLSAAQLCVILLLPVSPYLFPLCLSSPSTSAQIYKTIKLTHGGKKKSRKRLICPIRKKGRLNVRGENIQERFLTCIPCQVFLFTQIECTFDSCYVFKWSRILRRSRVSAEFCKNWKTTKSFPSLYIFIVLSPNFFSIPLHIQYAPKPLLSL